MTDDAYKRKLTTIFSTDAVGYSRLMGDDEAATVRTIELYRKIISDLIAQSRGRVIDSPGDNLLAEFSSVVDAVQCAVAVQKELQSRNAELADNRKMEFRIGINLGDVIEEGDRIYGDGVNIAARLESLADPEGICISKTAFDHIETKLPLGYEYMGGQEVKNITSPVDTYRVIMDPRVTVARNLKKSPNIRNRNIICGVVAVILIFGVTGIWQFYLKQPSVEPASEEKMVFPLPAKPSIAVLPFVNIGGDPDQGYFCDGLTDEIITSLSKIPKLFVISRNSVFTYKNKPVKINKVAEELGVRYVLEGSIRKAGDKIRISAQLIDALSGHHLWAERYDRQLKEIFSVQDDLTKNIITALQVKLTAGEQARSGSRGTESLEAYLKLLQAAEIWRKMTEENNILARQLANEIIVLDPNYANAYGLIAATHMIDVFLGTSKLPKESLRQAVVFNEKSLALDDSLAVSYSRLGLLYVMMRQHDKGIKQAERGVELDPNSALTHDLLGVVLSYSGRHEEATVALLKAIRLEPLAPGNYYLHLCRAYFFSGKCKEAIAACGEARRRVNNLFVHVDSTVVYSICGEEKKAREMAAEVLKISPNFSSDNHAKRIPQKDPADVNLYIGALHNAGLN